MRIPCTSSTFYSTQSPEMLATPEQEYGARLHRRREELAAIRTLHHRLWATFGVTLLALFVALIAAYSRPSMFSRVGCALAATMVVGLVRRLHANHVRHGRVRQIADFYEHGLTRCTGTGWQGNGIGGPEYQPDRHLYAADLDLFGKGSLFELLCTAQSEAGRATLAGWLLNPATPREIRARQEAVAELRARLDIQEDCAALGNPFHRTFDRLGLDDWLNVPDVEIRLWEKLLSVALPILAIAGLSLLALEVLSGPQRWIALLPLLGEALFAALLRRRVKLVIKNVVWCAKDLSVVAPLIERFGRETFTSPLLNRLQAGLTCSGKNPVRSIRSVSVASWILNLRESTDWFPVLSAPLLCVTNLAMLLERWRRVHRHTVPVWLESIGQTEAILCLARYSFENPDHTFPVVRDLTTPFFRAERLGHPLLPGKVSVRCDLDIGIGGGGDAQLLVVSGSNMAGKSTLLRTVGVNSVLAFAGGPVRAAQLEVAALDIACSISMHDSLTEGKSRFQAEVERLKWIVGLAEQRPVLFLLDEVLGGTNSKDRFFGTRALVERLLARGSVGLMTTHDLAVTEIVAALGARAANVHFEEQYENGEMRFDYQLRTGALTRTNGLQVMAVLGLVDLCGWKDEGSQLRAQGRAE